jgi:hypothetical protein
VQHKSPRFLAPLRIIHEGLGWTRPLTLAGKILLLPVTERLFG